MMIFIVLLGILLINGFFLWIGLGFFRGAIAGAPFVPTGNKTVEEMISLAGNISHKKIYDLGCGDGRIVFAAAKKGANAIGIELSYPIYLLALFKKKLMKSNASIIHASLWDIDVSDADIIFVYLLPAMMKKFEQEKYPTLAKGAIVISNGFKFSSLSPFLEIKKGKGKQIIVYKK